MYLIDENIFQLNYARQLMPQIGLPATKFSLSINTVVQPSRLLLSGTTITGGTDPPSSIKLFLQDKKVFSQCVGLMDEPFLQVLAFS
jgi:hypothetical protein